MNRNNGLDERQERIIGKAGVIATLITYIYLIVEMLYKYVTTKDIFNCNWELGLLIIISVVINVIIRTDKELDLPKNFVGITLSLGNTKEDKLTRIKDYLVDSIVFSIIIGVITCFFECVNIKYLIIEGFGLLIVSFIISYFSGEHKIKKYNKWLDEEE